MTNNYTLHVGRGYIDVTLDPESPVSGAWLHAVVLRLKRDLPVISISVGLDQRSDGFYIRFNRVGAQFVDTLAAAGNLLGEGPGNPEDGSLEVVTVHNGVAFIEPMQILTVRRVMNEASRLTDLMKEGYSVWPMLYLNAITLRPTWLLEDTTTCQDLLARHFKPRLEVCSHVNVGHYRSHLCVTFGVPPTFQLENSGLTGLILRDPAPRLDDGNLTVFIDGPRYHTPDLWRQISDILRITGTLALEATIRPDEQIQTKFRPPIPSLR